MLKKFGIAVSQCEKRNAIYDIYGKLKKETVDFKNRENRFCFYHPVTFIDHVKNNVLLEYNPYEGMTYKEVYGETEQTELPKIKGENFTEPPYFKIVDTPGFAGSCWSPSEGRAPPSPTNTCSAACGTSSPTPT